MGSRTPTHTPLLPGWALWLLAAVVVSVVAGPALGLGFVHDDVVLLGAGSAAAQPETLPAALGHDLFWLAGGAVRPSPYWRPVVVATYYLEHALGGGSPWAFHLGNLVALATLAVVAARRARDRLGQLVILAVVLLHPLQAEAAANITARTDTLAALFGTLAVFQVGLPGALLTLLALGSKEVAVVVPLLALLRAREGGLSRSAWLPHALATAGWVAGRQVLVGSWGIAAEDLGGPTLAGVVGAGGRVAFYLGRLLWPVDPTPARVLPGVEGLAALAGWGLLLLLAGVVVVGARRARTAASAAPAESSASWRLGLATVVLPLLPVSGLLVGTVRYAEGFLVWPLVGAAWMLAALPRGRALVAVLMIPLAVPLRAQVMTWRDEGTLWATAALRYPDDPLVALKVSKSRLGAGDAAGAEDAIAVALRGSLPPRQHREACAVGARLRIERGDDSAALPLLAVAAQPDDPEATWALTARCVVEVAEGTANQGVSSHGGVPLVDVCADALRRSPDDADLHNAAGVLAARSGDLTTARLLFSRAVELSPDRPEFRANLQRATPP